MKRATTAGALLEQLLQQKGMACKLHAYRSWLVWNEVVGPQIAAHAQPARIRDGVLEVRVDQAVWMQQLQLMKPKILTRINERLGGEPLTDIFWRRGSVGQQQPTPSPKDKPPAPTLPDEKKAEIEEIIAAINNTEVKEGLRTLLSQQARLDLTRGQD